MLYLTPTHYSYTTKPSAKPEQAASPLVAGAYPSDTVLFGARKRKTTATPTPPPAPQPPDQTEDPSEIEYRARLTQAKSFVGTFPLYAIISLRQLSEESGQPENICLSAIAELYLEGRILPNKFSTLRDSTWAVVKKPGIRDGQPYTEDIFSTNPALSRLLRDSTFMAGRVEHRQDIKTQLAIDKFMASIRSALSTARYNIHIPSNPDFFTDMGDLLGIRREQMERTLRGMFPTDSMSEYMQQNESIGRMNFQLNVMDDGDEETVQENEDFDTDLSAALVFQNVLNESEESHQHTHQQTLDVLRKLLPAVVPGQSVIDDDLLGETVYEHVKPAGMNFIQNKKWYLDFLKAQYSHKPNARRGKSGRSQAQQDKIRLLSGYLARVRQLSYFEKKFLDDFDRRVDGVLCELVGKGLIDARYRFTDKVLEYRRTDAFGQRFNQAGDNKRLTFYLVPPTEHNPDEWKLGYCWQLPRQGDEKDPPRIAIPSSSYHLPSFVLDENVLQSETESAVTRAAEIFPELEHHFFPGIPPRPIKMTTDEALAFNARYAYRLKNAGFNVLFPSAYLEAKATPELPANPLHVPQGAMDGLPVGMNVGAMSAVEEHHLLVTGSWQELDKVDQLRKFRLGVERSLYGHEDSRVRKAARDTDTVFHLEALLGRLSSISEFQEQTTLPDGLRAQLLPFQMTGYSFLKHNAENGMGAILADEMGLGKTVEALAMIQDRYNNRTADTRKPTLVVCPKSVIPEWQAHIHGDGTRAGITSIPEDEVLDLPQFLERYRTNPTNAAKPSAAQAKDIHQAIQKAAIVLTTYETMREREELLANLPDGWDGILLDEAHRIRTPNAAWTKTAHKLASQADYRVALTGTPIQNHIGDLWALGAFVNPRTIHGEANPHAYMSLEEYRDKYIKPSAKLEERQTVLNDLIDGMEFYMLRRDLSNPQVLAELGSRMPKVQHYRIFTPLDDEQVDLTNKAYKIKNQHKMITTLRQITLHPFLTRKNVPAAGQSDSTGDYTVSSKMPSVKDSSRKSKPMPVDLKITSAMEALAEIIQQDVLPNQQQMVIFSPFKGYNRLLQQYLEGETGRQVLLFDGDHRFKKGRHPIQLFKQKANTYPILIMTDQIGGEGLNLQNANHIVDFSPNWNPKAQDQRIARVRRMLPTEEAAASAPGVRVYHFTTYIKDAGSPSEDVIISDGTPQATLEPFEVPGMPTIDSRIEEVLCSKRWWGQALLSNLRASYPGKQMMAGFVERLRKDWTERLSGTAAPDIQVAPATA